MESREELEKNVEFKRREERMAEYQNSDEYRSKLLTRLQVLEACQNSVEARVWAMEACRKDPKFFINNFCWTPNDKYKQYDFPFILFPFQEEYVDWLREHVEEGRDGLTEKSREMGVTWVITATMLWFWLFSDNFNALLGSYKQELVDDKTKDSLFGMLDYNLRSLPKWMLPKRYKHTMHRTRMKLVNPENNNVIKGDTMNPEFGRGSRRSVVFLDEGAFWEYFQDAWDAAADTTNCRLTVSTPNGYNAFAVLRNSDIDKMTLHWRRHPLKDEAWYEYEKSRRTVEQVAQELDINYNKSQTGRVYPEWENVEYGEFPYDPQKPLYVSWDFGRSDDTALIWWQRNDDGTFTIVDCYWNTGKLIDFYVPFVTGIIPSDGYGYKTTDLAVIEEHRGWHKGTHFGDPSGRFQNQVTNATVLTVLRDNGIHVNFRDDWKRFNLRIPAARKVMMNGLKVNRNKRTEYLNICMINSQFTEVSRGGMTITNSKGLEPRHDATSHLRSSFEYGALGIDEYSRTVRKVWDRKTVSSTGYGRRRVTGGY